MNQDITYRIAAKEDYLSVLMLYNKMYKSNRSLVDFEWLNEDNPAGRATLFIALKEGRVVGMQSLIPYLFIRNGQLIKTYKSEDTLVEIGLRGKGILSKLYKMVHEYAGNKLIWGLTDKKEILERVSMPSSERLTIVVSVNRPSLKSENIGLQKFVAKTIFYTLLYLKSSFKSKVGNPKFQLREVDPADYGGQKLQAFFKAMGELESNILFPVMDAEYLNWRLLKNPNLEKYKIFCSYDEDGAIAICSIIGFQGKSAYWESYYALPHIAFEEKVGHIVLLKEKIFKSGVHLIHSWMFVCNPLVSQVKELFYRAGFSKVRDGLWIVHNSTDNEIDVHDLYFSPQLGIR